MKLNVIINIYELMGNQMIHVRTPKSLRHLSIYLNGKSVPSPHFEIIYQHESWTDIFLLCWTYFLHSARVIKNLGKIKKKLRCKYSMLIE